jgi:hypothetical protein
MTTTTESRAITLTDLPLLRRLSGRGILLDTELSLTQDTHGVPSSHLSSLLFNRGVYTFVARDESQQVLGQFRYKPDDVNAHILYLAPALDEVSDDSVWLAILDAMTREAGKMGAHTLIGEVDTQSRLYETLRQARFACYVRQTIWHHAPSHARQRVTLSEETSNDQIGIMSLICHTIPTLQQGVATPNNDCNGLVYRHNGQVEAYIAYSEGKNGVYLIPYIHPDIARFASDILESAVAHIGSQLPIYVCVRSYQAWLNDAVCNMNFQPVTEQAIMVRQIAAGVRHVAFTRSKINGKLEPAHRVTPPYWSSARPPDEE